MFRYVWGQLAEKALSSYIAEAMLKLDVDEIVSRLESQELIDPDTAKQLRIHIPQRLSAMANQGKREREILAEVARHFTRMVLDSVSDYLKEKG